MEAEPTQEERDAIEAVLALPSIERRDLVMALNRRQQYVVAVMLGEAAQAFGEQIRPDVAIEADGPATRRVLDLQDVFNLMIGTLPIH